MMNCASLRSSSRPFVGVKVSAPRTIAVNPGHGALIVQNAHKKGAGSTKNGRDSNSKSRGVKVFGGQPVTPGGIIVRQLGNKWHAGNNVGTGKDYTLYSVDGGIVVFETIKQKSCVSVYPDGHEKTEGLQLKRQPGSKASKRIEKWKGTPRR